MLRRTFAFLLLVFALLMIFVFTPMATITPSGQPMGPDQYISGAISLGIATLALIGAKILSNKK